MVHPLGTILPENAIPFAVHRGRASRNPGGTVIAVAGPEIQVNQTVFLFIYNSKKTNNRTAIGPDKPGKRIAL